MFAGIQKIYGPLAGLAVSLVSMSLLGTEGPTEQEIAAVSAAVNELISLGIGTAVAIAVTYLKRNVNVNGIVQAFVDREGNVQDASGKKIGAVATGSTVLRSPPIVTFGALGLLLLPLGGCATLAQKATDLGVSLAVQQACIDVVAQELPGITKDTDFGAVKDRLQENGLSCLIAGAKDALTAQLVKAPTPAAEGEILAASPAAAEAVAAE